MKPGDCMDDFLGELESELAEEGTTVREKMGGWEWSRYIQRSIEAHED